MSEIIFCNQALSQKAFKSQCGINIDQISAFNFSKPTMVAANTPYRLESNSSNVSKNVLGLLSPMPVSRKL